MAAQIAGVFEGSLQAKINASKILVVGAGGIGCEILKNLVLCGFKDIEIVSWPIVSVFVYPYADPPYNFRSIWTPSM